MQRTTPVPDFRGIVHEYDRLYTPNTPFRFRATDGTFADFFFDATGFVSTVARGHGTHVVRTETFQLQTDLIPPGFLRPLQAGQPPRPPRYWMSQWVEIPGQYYPPTTRTSSRNHYPPTRGTTNSPNRNRHRNLQK